MAEIPVREWSVGEAVAVPGTCLDSLVTMQALRTPSAVAVRDEKSELTYAQLVSRARSVACELVARGVKADCVVGVCAQRSVDLLAGLLGILMAGAAYLPLDPDDPDARLAHMLSTAGASVVVCGRAQTGRISAAVPDAALVRLDYRPPSAASPAAAATASRSEDGLAYVIFTSGSTGRPKGVAVPHSGIVNRLLWMQDAYRLEPDDVVLQKTPYTFDVSVWELFWPLLVGATVLMARPGGHRDPGYLVQTVQVEQVTVMHCVPTMLSALLEEPSLEKCTSLKRVVSSGESLSPEAARRLGEILPVELCNLYGPTEASVDVTSWTYRPGGARRSLPIGRPIHNTRTYVAAPDGTLAPVGQVGELYLGGSGLARGYAGNPRLTAEYFVPDSYSGVPGARLYRTGDNVEWNAQGELDFIGRSDQQVKIRGMRVELLEIEAVLCVCPQVQDAVVLLRRDEGLPETLVAYLVGAQGAVVDVAAVREYVRQELPEHMVPSAFVALEAFPLTSSGKTDRGRLPEPARR